MLAKQMNWLIDRLSIRCHTIYCKPYVTTTKFTSEHIRFYFVVFLFFHFLVVGSVRRLSRLMWVFARTLKQIVSYIYLLMFTLVYHLQKFVVICWAWTRWASIWVYVVQQAVCTDGSAGAPRAHTHRRETVPVCNVWQGVRPVGAPAHPHEVPQRREGTPVHRLQAAIRLLSRITV